MNAVEAAVRMAEQFGLRVEKPVLLRSTNNVVAWLRPSSVVAKIGVGHRRGFSTEVAVAWELSALGAPVVPLASEIPAAVHVLDDFTISFWRYYPQPLDVDIPAGQVAAALLHLHTTSAQLSAELRATLPSYRAELIHGSPHPYNLLLVDGAPRFIDFETTCIGPVEWISLTRHLIPFATIPAPWTLS